MTEQPNLPAKARPADGAPAVFTRLRDEIDRLFDDFSLVRPGRGLLGFPPVAAFSPALEFTEKKDRYDVSIELPGMDEKDIDIECADGVLTISGEKREESEEKTDGYLVTERSYGSFKRQVMVPADVDPDAIQANFAKGVLTLKLKKDGKAASRVKKIAIG
jgi:HSP20 family protein